MPKSNAFRVGNANLRGKKTKRLRCNCCTAINHKDSYNKELIIKNIRKEYAIIV